MDAVIKITSPKGNESEQSHEKFLEIISSKLKITEGVANRFLQLNHALLKGSTIKGEDISPFFNGFVFTRK